MGSLVKPNRYTFLHDLHKLLQPRGYLEIGVQHGGSLALAECPALGIDPAPLVIPGTAGPQAHIVVAGSDHYFAYVNTLMPEHVDLVFIDGLHLAEQALRDFMNVERRSHEGTVIVFDDVLPYAPEIATRTEVAGAWTGDVWKMISVLRHHRQDLRMLLVDSPPTGALVVFGINPNSRVLNAHYRAIEESLRVEQAPPHWVLSREQAVPMQTALDTLRDWKATL